jgi:hypothetical protein
MMRLVNRWIGVLFVASVIFVAGRAGAAIDEFSLKAAFLFNFTRFVEWPAEAFPRREAVFRICVFGTDPFGARIDALARRSVGERTIEVARPTTVKDLPSCQIAYLGGGAPDAVKAAAIGSRAPATLTVASDAAFARDGGMVALVTTGNRVRLHVNLGSVRRSSLRVSAKLLEVSEVRHDGTGGRW